MVMATIARYDSQPFESQTILQYSHRWMYFVIVGSATGPLYSQITLRDIDVWSVHRIIVLSVHCLMWSSIV